MYNELRKEEYIEKKYRNSVLPSVNYLENIFIQTEKYEEEYDKDVSTFSPQEIIQMYKGMGYTNIQMLQNLNAALSQYTIYCIDEGYILDKQNFYAITSPIKVLSGCINTVSLKQKYISREEILSICNNGKVKNPMEKFVLLGLYEGISGTSYNDLIDAERSDFNATDLKYNAKSGRVFNISKELYGYAKESWEEDIYYFTNGREQNFIKSDKCIKSFRILKSEGSGSERQRQRSSNKKIRKCLDNIFSEFIHNGNIMSSFMKPNDIYESGKIYYFKEKIKERGITFDEYIKSDFLKEDAKKRYYELGSKNNFSTKYGTILSEMA